MSFEQRRIAMNNKKLYKSRIDKKLFGVCGGIAEFFNIDSTIVRLLTIVLCCIGGTGVVIYIAAALLMPYKPDDIIIN